MDSFLREINSEAFKQWIYSQKSDLYTIHEDESNKNKIDIETDFAFGQIGFYSLDIIELSVTNKRDNSQEFYLHFQMNTMKHAIELFNEMIDCIVSIGKEHTVKVLLSCSGGLTTGYFAEELNKTIELFNVDYEFDAVPYTKLPQKGKEYDVIIIAPQIGYMKEQIQKVMPDKPVLTIPSGIFAKYDSIECITWLKGELERREKIKKVQQIELKKEIKADCQVMVVAALVTSSRVRIYCRIYDERSRILFDKKIIKYKLSLDDIIDTIDMVLLDFPDVEKIGVSMPGIVYEGHLTLPSDGFNNTDIIGLLSRKYNKKVVLGNDINCVAVGYYASQEEYKNISFIYQPVGKYAGMGNILNGNLITGNHSMAGEIKFMPIESREKMIELSRSEEGTIELLSKYIVSTVVTLDPEVFVVCNVKLHDVNELKKEIRKYLDDQYIPNIIKVEHLSEYIILGQMILTVESK